MGTTRVVIAAGSMALLGGLMLGMQHPASSQEGAAGTPGVEELTRGPVHEAFEQPVVFNPKPGLVVPKQPPKPIEELPPEQKPAGENIEWVAGYWGWDPAREDFVWVSGFWRAIPPGKQWIEGYWTKAGSGWQWISGYWKSADSSEVQYLPAPPDSLENGPSIEQPGADHIWVPGCWRWYRSHYVWRPGYWIEYHPGWVWVPAHYVWTPSGCIYVDGYYDRVAHDRGMLFAPVYIDPVVYVRPRFYYRPRIIIDIDLLTDHYFAYPHYHHYCFGDYYADSFVHIGISPWFSFHYSRGGYCSTFAYFHAHHRHHRHHDWHRHLERDYRHRREHREDRPEHTFREQRRERGDRDDDHDGRRRALAKPLEEVAAAKKLERINEQNVAEIRERVKNSQEFRGKRLKLETEASENSPLKQAREKAQPLKLEMPKSTVVSKQRSEEGANVKLPRPPETPNVQGEQLPRGRRDRDSARESDDDEPRRRGSRSEDPNRNQIPSLNDGSGEAQPRKKEDTNPVPRNQRRSEDDVERRSIQRQPSEPERQRIEPRRDDDNEGIRRQIQKRSSESEERRIVPDSTPRRIERRPSGSEERRIVPRSDDAPRRIERRSSDSDGRRIERRGSDDGSSRRSFSSGEGRSSREVRRSEGSSRSESRSGGGRRSKKDD